VLVVVPVEVVLSAIKTEQVEVPGGNTTVGITGRPGTMMVCLGCKLVVVEQLLVDQEELLEQGKFIMDFLLVDWAGVAGAVGAVADSRVQGINSTFGGGGAGQSAELTSAAGGRLLTGSTAQTQVLNPDLPVNTVIKSNGESGFPTMILRKYSTGYGGAGGNNAALTGTASNGGRGYRGSGRWRWRCCLVNPYYSRRWW
jgi:hypothetical protein